MPVRSVRASTLCLMAVLATVAAGGMAHADDGRRGGKGQGGARSADDSAAREAAQARRSDSDARGQSPRQRQRDALADSVREASRRGQVLSAESVPYDGRNINRVKVIDERGRVRVYMDDPQSSRPLRRTRGDDD
ncbi:MULTISPECIES: hypothetical protein [unclassified Luteimonas]|uniref:hypothetical protein n=1 Tax=unclassified Luteimonas TaxID=2629088 RepID=UPI0018F0A306|nr:MULTISPECIES: hypothetical protein [unclassified Luteimonas]MBJ6981561.1 hypothetical protein [Luteimonas sp. MC1572]MBJ7575871.1 hypothetical protein [Luteimonas sp. MC1828]QQO02860.1 hypothetical protein JGR64_11950 [Luteimonas sp. MC1572]